MITAAELMGVVPRAQLPKGVARRVTLAGWINREVGERIVREREQSRARWHKWRARHPEVSKAEWRAANADRVRASRRKWELKNREKLRSQWRARSKRRYWADHEAGLARNRASRARRRARKLVASV